MDLGFTPGAGQLLNLNWWLRSLEGGAGCFSHGTPHSLTSPGKLLLCSLSVWLPQSLHTWSQEPLPRPSLDQCSLGLRWSQSPRSRKLSPSGLSHLWGSNRLGSLSICWTSDRVPLLGSSGHVDHYHSSYISPATTLLAYSISPLPQ